jgi:hypothetical protein
VNALRDFPLWPYFSTHRRKAMCRTCHVAMVDLEPATRPGAFVHPRIDRHGNSYLCPHVGKSFSVFSTEIEPFMRKAARRRSKRHRVTP